MKISVNLLSKTRHCSLINFSRLFSSKQYEKIQGIRDNFSEYEVRLHFDKWLKSLWLAPNQWVHSTRDGSIRVTRCFIPFWNINFQGDIQCTLSTKANFPFRHDENYYSQKEWHTFPLQMNNISLNNINIYAANNLDKYHIQKLDVSFDDVEPIDLTDQDYIIEKCTIDQDTAFKNAWILITKPLLENMCLEEAKKIYPKFEEPRIDSFHLIMNSKQERLLYYPIYIINYKYDSQLMYTCLFDGVTGHITGDRQFSAIKVTLASLVAFYPMIKIGLFSFGTLVDFLFAFEIASELSFSVALPMAFIIAPLVGFYARSYPKSYKKQISSEQWTQDQFKTLKFTYAFDQQQKNQISNNDSSVHIASDDEIKSIKQQHSDLNDSANTLEKRRI
ncbi:unnamed protein product [Adineta steineri]|uniref:Uncharacterized protein n=1 Tax=Adineta steineri TaxID=433720 RepID=A0A819NPH9_9BILA|nr:unnamed protein product [Adineta steineri]